MPLAAKTRLGPYEIIAPVGAGGMGDVDKARDTRLDRTVALKICAVRFTGRFAREARLANGPLPLAEAIQIAGALDVAQRKGIVHRDLKLAWIPNIGGSGIASLPCELP